MIHRVDKGPPDGRCGGVEILPDNIILPLICLWWLIWEEKVAVPTRGYAGLNDVVLDVFGKANTFTIVEVENREIVGVHVIENRHHHIGMALDL